MARRMDGPVPVTPSTRPPEVTASPFCRRVPAWNTCKSGKAAAFSSPRTTLPFSYGPGYPPAASTTQQAAPGRLRTSSPPRSPRAAAARSSNRSDSSRGSTAWVSGSPKRQLNSTTRTSPPRIISPTYRQPRYGLPSFSSPRSVGFTIRSSTARSTSGVTTGAGA